MVTVKKIKDEQSSEKKQIVTNKSDDQKIIQCSITKTNTHEKFCSYNGVIGWICRHDPEHMVP